MLRHAIWVLEHEIEFARKHFDWGTEGPPTVEDDPWWIFGGMLAAGAQTVAITAMPYAGLARAHGLASDYLWMRTAPQHRIRGFKISSPGFKPIPFGWSTSRKAMFRLGVAKVATRFIPYVGWGLAAYDLYSVGKWALGKARD